MTFSYRSCSTYVNSPDRALTAVRDRARRRTQIDQFGRDPDGQGDRRTAVQNGGDVRAGTGRRQSRNVIGWVLAARGKATLIPVQP
jgi:hypothetical protein